MDLRLPIVYNCSGYESVEVIRLLDGVVDSTSRCKIHGMRSTQGLSPTPLTYPESLRVLKEMHRQVGDLKINPGHRRTRTSDQASCHAHGAASSESVLKFIAEEISVHSYVNIMEQYRPEYLAERSRHRPPITRKEYLEAIQAAKRFHLYRGF